MSWNEYTNYLTTNGCQVGYIIGRDNGLIWACTNEKLEKLPCYVQDTQDDNGNDIQIQVNETEALLSGKNIKKLLPTPKTLEYLIQRYILKV